MKEGYLQLKIRDLEDKIKQSEKRIETIIETVSIKEREFSDFIEKISSYEQKSLGIIKSFEDYDRKRAKFQDFLEECNKAARLFIEKKFDKMVKKQLIETNKQLNELKNHINYTIADHTTGAFILGKMLMDKGIIDQTEMIKYIDKYHNEIRKKNLQSPPQKALKMVMEKMK